MESGRPPSSGRADSARRLWDSSPRRRLSAEGRRGLKATSPSFLARARTLDPVRPRPPGRSSGLPQLEGLNHPEITLCGRIDQGLCRWCAVAPLPTPKERSMRFIEKAQQRLRGEESGFTLIELSSSSSSSASCSRSPSRPTSASSSAPNRAAGSNVRGARSRRSTPTTTRTWDMTIAALKYRPGSQPERRAASPPTAYCIQSDADGAGSGTNAVHHFRGPGVDDAPAGRLLIRLRAQRKGRGRPRPFSFGFLSGSSSGVKRPHSCR